MKNLFITIGFALLVCSCTSNATKDLETGIFTPPVIIPDESQHLSTVGVVSAAELRDDSVFADGSIPTSWENAGITDVKALKLFLKELQQLVMLNDKAGLSGHVQYPLKDIPGPEAFIAQYDEVFTRNVKLSLAGINFNQVFRNQDGVMTAGGKVWIRQIGEGFKIIAINN